MSSTGSGVTYASIALRTRLRARCSRIRWLPAEISSASLTSSELQPSMSRNPMTVRCATGSAEIAVAITSRVSPASRPSSGIGQRAGGIAQWPG
jgi:hypothetical protein